MGRESTTTEIWSAPPRRAVSFGQTVQTGGSFLNFPPHSNPLPSLNKDGPPVSTPLPLGIGNLPSSNITSLHRIAATEVHIPHSRTSSLDRALGTPIRI